MGLDTRLRAIALALLVLLMDGAIRAAAAQCHLEAVDVAKAEFNRLVVLQRLNPKAVKPEAVSEASRVYVSLAEACFDQLYAGSSDTIDEGGVRMDDGLAYYNLSGRKWGGDTPFAASGNDNTGPHSSGGTVTYSFMGDGLDMSADATSGAGPSVSIASLPGYSACFLSEISAAFSAWSAVANIQFVQVADSGVAFDAPGATGDIRIGAHTFDGPSNVLAHAYFPPPNGSSSAGDMHFDRQESWGCTAGPGVIDIGIVALHEIGHSLGLGHEVRTGRRAVMNPTYNPSVANVLLGDDIDAGINIYGSSVGATDDVLVNFGTGVGAWRFNYGVGWTLIHPFTVESLAVGDLDGSGVDDLVVDFGLVHGVWRFMNNSTWSPLHGLSPTRISVGDLDGNGRDDVVMDFPSYGLYAYYNGTTWAQLHPTASTAMAFANLDGTAGDELIVNFSGQGVWTFRNNATWTLLHGVEASSLVVGAFDAAAGRQDLVIVLEHLGMFKYINDGTWIAMHNLEPVHITSGDLDSDGRDDLVVDFGAGVGIYTLLNGTTWGLLHGASSKSITMADLDGNGQDDVVIDFGGVGIWVWVNRTTWMPIHGGTAVSDLTVGDFN